MNITDLAVVLIAAGLTVLLWRFFFGARRASRAELHGGVQEVRVTVKGGDAPDRIEVEAGTPVRLLFDRRETGDCTSRVVFSDFGINRSLPAFATTTVELTPDEPGEFGFGAGPGAMALSSLSVVTNANRLRRFIPIPLPESANPRVVDPAVEIGADHAPAAPAEVTDPV